VPLPPHRSGTSLPAFRFSGLPASRPAVGGRYRLIMPLLFSYGTLRNPAVQRSTFGRELTGRDDRIVGFRLDQLEITDPHVLAVSGQTHHPILTATGDPADTVDGGVLEVTDEELLRADTYEVDDYRRVEVPLASGGTAWVYVGSDCDRRESATGASDAVTQPPWETDE
jgi:gamma-glutamylcyclotransferase (GGCT)/AIG2-like uncharacterized protein YtfP